MFRVDYSSLCLLNGIELIQIVPMQPSGVFSITHLCRKWTGFER